MTQMDGSNRRDVAIVGIGCRFPAVDSAAAFWRMLCEEREIVGDIPADRIDMAAYFDPRPATPGKMAARRGGFLSGIEQFDAGFFDISPREAAFLDPQQRLLLETAWEALEDAGVDVASLSEVTTGVFIGQWTSDFEARVFTDPRAVDFYAVQGSGRYASSGRISYALGLHGPSITIDTACSSSLVAVHLATRSIRSGESDVALVGAANLILQPHISIGYSQSRMMAEDGRCKFGDASGDGYVRSEGAAVIVLKSLERAQRDGDRVCAVIRGSAVTNDGNSSGSMGTPSSIGQVRTLRAAYRDAGIDPSCVGYVEAHGTGTRAGDPVELKSLTAVLGAGRDPGQPLHVGSVKTNLGHTEAVAGLAGLIKACLVLRHESIPASLNFNNPNPNVPWRELLLVIPRTPVPWPRASGSRLAGVTALGISGTNAHVVLEEAPDEMVPIVSSISEQALLLPLSARSKEALQQLALRYANQLESDRQLALNDVCWSAATRRSALSYRAAVVAENKDDMIKGLRDLAENGASTREIYGGEVPKICFVCPGQGAQWLGMARELMGRQPAFRAALEECDRAASLYVDYSIIAQLEKDADQEDYRLTEISVIQPVLVALTIAYARLLGKFGVVPSAIIGHSMGEVAAACIAGVIEVDRAMQIVCRRSALMQRASGQGAMAVVELSMDGAARRLAGWEDRVNVAVSNSPRSSVISGEPAAVRQIMAELERDGVFCRTINVDVASHSPQMAQPAATLAAELAGMATSDAQVPIWSAVRGGRAQGSDFDAVYWGRNLREPVRFAGAVNELLDADISIFVELGPHPVLLHAIEETAQMRGGEATTISCSRREENESASFLTALGQLWTAGYPLAWDRVLPKPGRFVSLPLYPWQREKHWAPTANIVSGSVARLAPEVPRDEEALSWIYTQTWKATDLKPLGKATRTARYLVIGADEQAQANWRKAFAAAGADATVAQWDSLDQAIDATARDAADFAGILLLLPEASDAPYLSVRALQAVMKQKWRVTPQLWFVTRGAQAADPNGGELLSIDHAAAWGTCRVIAEEHPELWGGLIDLDPKAFGAGDVSMVVHHVVARDGEDQVAIRGNRRFVLRIARKALDESKGIFRPRHDAAYLITGGLGDMGLRLAKTMADCGARRLILMGRSPLPPRDSWGSIDPDTSAGQRVTAIRALEANGVAVHVACVDVSDEFALGAFLDNYHAEAWPPIRGIVHAAGVVDDCLTNSITRAHFSKTLTPKLQGAQHLDRLLPDLDLFALMSSMASFLPHSGQANYAAANAGLDALALNRRARGASASSICWGAWEDTGMMKGSGAQKLAELAREGIQTMPPSQAAGLLPWLCASDEPNITALRINWSLFKQARVARNHPIFADAIADAAPTQDQIVTGQNEDNLGQIVRKAVSAVLKIAPARLDPRKPLGTMGLTSLMAIELRNILEGALKRPLSATLAWNHPTIEALVEFLDAGSSKPSEMQVQAGDATNTSTAIELAALSNLSDAEALAALRNVAAAR